MFNKPIFLGLLAAIVAVPSCNAAYASNDDTIVVEGKRPHKKLRKLDSAYAYEAGMGTLAWQTAVMLDTRSLNVARPMRTGATRWKGGNMPSMSRFGNVNNIEEAYVE